MRATSSLVSSASSSLVSLVAATTLCFILGGHVSCGPARICCWDAGSRRRVAREGIRCRLRMGGGREEARQSECSQRGSPDACAAWNTRPALTRARKTSPPLSDPAPLSERVEGFCSRDGAGGGERKGAEGGPASQCSTRALHVCAPPPRQTTPLSPSTYMHPRLSLPSHPQPHLRGAVPLSSSPPELEGARGL
eukprot:1950661-Rhodomonas_salina.2